MKLKQLLAKSALAAGVGLAAFGLAGGLASAQPYVPTPPPVPPIPDVPCVPTPGCTVRPDSSAAAAGPVDPSIPQP